MSTVPAPHARVRATPPPAPMARGWYSFKEYLDARFGSQSRVFKIMIDAGFTCPNIDGTLAKGGCTYCNNRSFSPPARTPGSGLAEQVAAGLAYYRSKFDAERFIAYFQAWTNTYAPVATLRRIYDEVLGMANFVGLDIGTRPDCVPEEVLDLIESYTDRYDVWIEYGLQTIHDATLTATNRGHDARTFLDAFERARRRGIPVCVHLIHGLPGETPAMMRETADAIGALAPDGIKIHHCYVPRGTALAGDLRAGRYAPIDLETYVDLVAYTLEALPETTVVHRLLGHLPGGDADILAPDFGVSKPGFLRRVEDELERRGTRQGARFARGSSSSWGRPAPMPSTRLPAASTNANRT